MTSVYIREGQREIGDRRKETKCEDDAEIGVMGPQAEEAKEPAAAGDWTAGKNFPLEPFAVRIVDTLQVPPVRLPYIWLDFRTRSLVSGWWQRRCGSSTQHSGQLRTLLQSHSGTCAAPAQDPACAFWSSGQSMALALEWFLEVQPRVCSLPNLPFTPPQVNSGSYTIFCYKYLLCFLLPE